MSTQELEDKHADIRFQPLNYDEFYEIKHTKLSVEFAISILEGVPKFSNVAQMLLYTNNKTQELKKYLDENI
jgi:hypothetical protein